MRRPLRDTFETNVTDKIPSGPLGKIGEGDVIGAGGFIAVEATRPFFTFVPGLKQPGYHVTSHTTDTTDDGEVHTVTVTAISEDVAEFVAQYTASPSNVNFLVSNIELLSTEVVTERSTYSTYRMEVLLEEE